MTELYQSALTIEIQWKRGILEDVGNGRKRNADVAADSPAKVCAVRQIE